MRICRTCSTTYPDPVGFCPKDGSPLAELHEWVPGATVRGKYRVLGTVGQGGMGSVYKALHLGFHELRALKVLNRELAADARFVKRFKQEAFTTRKLQHPNVVRVDDIDETEEGQPFIVMEFIEGRSLRRLIEKHGAMRVPAACSIARQIASALLVAHGMGIVHRDLKPDNIVLVAPSPGQGAAEEPMVKVLDFGISQLKEARATGNANAKDSTLTQPGFILGTPDYMSPEQAKGKRGDDLDGRSDIYSLGIVMYQMLTGSLPFHATTTLEMLLAHLQETPRPICNIRPDLQIPGPIADLVMQCLEKNREARPQTAKALIESLERAQAVSVPAESAQKNPPVAAPFAGQPAPDPDRDAAALREQDADQIRKREASLAHDREIQPILEAPAHETEVFVAREPETPEHAVTLKTEPEAAPEPEPPMMPAQDHETPLPQEPAATPVAATVMVPRADAANAVAATPAAARQQHPPIPKPKPPASSPTPLAAPEKPIRKRLGMRWAIALTVVVLLGTIGFLASNRSRTAANPNLAVTPPEPTPTPAIQSPTPAQQQQTPKQSLGQSSAQSSGEASETRKKPAQTSTPRPESSPKPSAMSAEEARALEVKKKISAAEAEGDSYQFDGKYDDAIRSYQQGLTLDPGNTALREKIAQALQAKKSEQKYLKH